MNKLISYLAKKKNISMKQLAEYLNITQSAISQWNENNISLDNLYKLSKLFNVTVDEIISNKLKDDSIYNKWIKPYGPDDIFYNNKDDYREDLVIYINRFIGLEAKYKISGELSNSEKMEYERIKRPFIELNTMYDILDFSEMTEDEIVWAIKNHWKYRPIINEYERIKYYNDEIYEEFIKSLQIVDQFLLDQITTEEYSRYCEELRDRYTCGLIQSPSEQPAKLIICLRNGGRILYDMQKIEDTAYPEGYFTETIKNVNLTQAVNIYNYELSNDLVQTIHFTGRGSITFSSLISLNKKEYDLFIDHRTTNYYRYRFTHNDEKDCWNYYKQLYFQERNKL